MEQSCKKCEEKDKAIKKRNDYIEMQRNGLILFFGCYVCLGLRKKEHKPKVLFILANEINVKQLKRLTYASTKLRIKF